MTRARRKISLRDLSAASGIAVGTIQALEKGDGKGEASCVTIAAIADALGVPRGWLAFGG